LPPTHRGSGLDVILRSLPGGRIAERLTITSRQVMGSLPAGLVQFARAHIHSLEALQVFLLCVDHRDRWWDAIGIARAVRISESRARRILDQLARANLLDIRISEAVRFRFAPGIQELEEQAVAFASAYHNNPTDVVKLIARSTVSDSVRDFADAFRIRRDDDR
jgi:hypothetical protein